ncbi:MAG: helicase-related protein, partial [Turicibacter sp.]
LQIEKEPFSCRDVKKGDALILFSKRRVLQLAKDYREVGIHTSLIYGDLPPEVRKMQYHDFIAQKNDVLVSTDAIGMGVNLPIRRIIFMNTKKFDGEEERWLTSQEVKQIGGRAGRKGIYEVGYVGGLGNSYSFIRDKIEQVDELILEAVIGPSEALLKIEGLPLKEKLALWSTNPVEVDLYRKMDIRDFILILDEIKRFKLDEKIEWMLMKLPFDVRNEEVFSTFIQYVDRVFVQQEELFKPMQFDESLDELEDYYQKVNLYYSLGKNFDFPFDVQWVYDERIRISELINELLIGGKY